MNRIFTARSMRSIHLARALSLFALVGFFFVSVPDLAMAGKAKSIKTEAFFVSLDPDTNVMEVKVKKTGKRPKNKKLKLKTGKSASFNVKPEGSVLKRTTVALDGQRVDIGEIEENQFLFIYWVPDEKDPDKRFARKIDLVLTDEQMDARNDARMEAARAAGQVSD